MAFGLSFGASSGKTKSTSVVDKTDTTNQTQSSTQASSGVTSTVGSSSQTGQSQGATTSAQQGTSSQQSQTTGQQQQTSALFSDPVLHGLEGAVTSLLGSVGGKPTVVGSFDPTTFVHDGLASARATQNNALDASINGLMSNIGGTPATNSAVALLANKAHGDAAANLAGIEGDLTARAQDISRSNVLAGNTIDATHQSFLDALLGALKGGVATTTGASTQATSQSGATAQQATGATSESSAQAGQTQSTQTQNLIQILDQLLNGTVHTTGTETVSGTQSKMGGGLSLSL